MMSVSTAAAAEAAAAVAVTVDCAKTTGTIRAIHGVNNGPLNFGEVVNLSAWWRQAGFPLARLHDSEWPAGTIADMHAVFPNPAADANSAASYDFARTDDYIQAIVDANVGIVYRLGESIEHSRRKYHVHVPADMANWSAACVGIVRHYNEGWAKGFHHNIRYWEIWNEPENRPVMWTGTDEDYYRLYAAASRAIKTRFPNLKVGGPSTGYAGDLSGDTFKPTAFTAGLLARCRRDKLPLDFFSWHTYCDDPGVLARKARAVRKMLDDAGFKDTESHLNEWNYLPDNDWGPVSRGATGEARRRCFDRITGPHGAAFVACALIGLLDARVDMTNYYGGDTNWFGLFDRYGKPRKNFFAMKAFHALLETPVRVEAGGLAGDADQIQAVCAGRDEAKTRVTILAANYRSNAGELDLRVRNLPWTGPAYWQAFAIDAERDLSASSSGSTGAGEEVRIRLPLPAPRVVLVRLSKTPPAPAKPGS